MSALRDKLGMDNGILAKQTESLAIIIHLVIGKAAGPGRVNLVGTGPGHRAGTSNTKPLIFRWLQFPA